MPFELVLLENRGFTLITPIFDGVGYNKPLFKTAFFDLALLVKDFSSYVANSEEVVHRQKTGESYCLYTEIVRVDGSGAAIIPSMKRTIGVIENIEKAAKEYIAMLQGTYPPYQWSVNELTTMYIRSVRSRYAEGLWQLALNPIS